MKRLLIALAVALLVPGLANAYPLFYTCSADGHLTDYVDAKDVQEQVLMAVDSPETDAQITETCKNSIECFSVLKQALLLTQRTAELANTVFLRLVKQIEARMTDIMGEVLVDDSVPKTAKSLVIMADSINECRKAQIDQTPTKFVFHGHEASDSTNGLDLFIQHGVDNEYNFVSGIGKTDEKNHKVDYDQVGTVIRQAVASNVDPYAALAVSFLEAGKASPFTSDPKPAFDAMGCQKVAYKPTGKKDANGKALYTDKIATFSEGDAAGIATMEQKLRASGQSFLYNFGTFYATKAQVTTSKASLNLAAELDRLKSAEGDPGTGPGFACVQTEGAFIADLSGNVTNNFGYSAEDGQVDLSMSTACCMKIPYQSDRVFSLIANKELASHLSGSGNTPEKILQKFNGLGVIGKTEQAGVGAFRFGMSMSTQPQYGAQGMDFILNSFLGNPAIRSMIESAEKDYGKNPKSLMCAEKDAGTYAVDSDRYTDMQKKMKRLNTIIGKNWTELSPSERLMAEREYSFVHDMIGVDNPNLTARQNAALQTAIRNYESQGSDAAKWAYYQSSIYPYRDTLGKTSMKTWSRFDDSQVLEMRRKILTAPAQ